MKEDGRNTTKNLMIIIASVLTICVVMLCAPAAYATPAYVVKDGRTAAAIRYAVRGDLKRTLSRLRFFKT